MSKGRNHRTRSSLAAIALLLTLGAVGCDNGAEFGGIVQIVPAPATWNDNTPFDASATIDQASGDEIPSDYVVTAVLEWEAPPGQQKPRLELTGSSVGNKQFRVNAPATAGKPAQMLSIRWFVEGTTNNLLAESDPQTFQIGCPNGPNPTLGPMQTTVLGSFGSLATIAQIAAAGYAPNTHGWAQIDGIGTTFVHPNPTLSVGTPSLLVFNAPPGANITDLQPDEPYTLVGWAYGRLEFVPGSPRPTLGCVPYHEWFVHEAGWHTPGDGGMVLDTAGAGPLAVPPDAVAAGGSAATYHPRLWDLHFWADPSGIPRATLLNTAPDGTLVPTGSFAPPPGIFFYPPID